MTRAAGPERDDATPSALVDALIAALAPTGRDRPLLALAAVAGDAVALSTRSVVGVVDAAAVGDVLATLERVARPRWVWWRAADLGAAVAALRPAACWDLAAVHRLLHGGGQDDAVDVWAAAAGLRPGDVPRAGQLDLLSDATSVQHDRTDRAVSPAGPDEGGGVEPLPPECSALLQPDGHLRPEAAPVRPLPPEVGVALARLALVVAARQARAVEGLRSRRPLAPLTARSESLAAVLAVELQHDGLPLDRAIAEQLLTSVVGARPRDAAEEARSREARDATVLGLVRGDLAQTDLRNPASVRAMLAALGVDVPDTRSWRLERVAGIHPVVPALLAWRKAERVATTYGWRWLDEHVGADDRLRGAWGASDGGAGRMTAQAGLHNLPAELRPAVAAHPGHVLVRADLGQIEPRVLATLSGDAALRSACESADLYAPVAQRLGSDRATAKVAVLAAMYGQTSGAAGEALRSMERAYPAALRFLRAAENEGRAGRPVRTHGGRLVRTAWGEGELSPAAVAARGRFARNAVVQGSAAELFKAWAGTVRARLRATGWQPPGEIVLCLHDELLLHVPASHGKEAAAAVVAALEETARWWTRAAPTRLVADVAVVSSWSEAKSPQAATGGLPGTAGPPEAGHPGVHGVDPPGTMRR